MENNLKLLAVVKNTRDEIEFAYVADKKNNIKEIKCNNNSLKKQYKREWEKVI